MILAIRTDSPTAELYIYDDGNLVAQKVWEAHRTLARDLLRECIELVDVDLLEGVMIYKGPGSFTGLRIGCTVANTMAYSQSIPTVGISGDGWAADGLERLQRGENDTSVLPDYGAEPRITSPQK